MINGAYEQRATISATSAPAEVRTAVEQTIQQLDEGTLRVAEKHAGTWVVHQWVKKAVLLSFRLNDNAPMQGGFGRRGNERNPDIASTGIAAAGVAR